MLVDVERFVCFNDKWFNQKKIAKDGMDFEPMTINADYVAWMRRWSGAGPEFDFCEIYIADRGGAFVVVKTYEEMKDLAKR